MISIEELREFDSLTKNMQDIITIIDNTCVRQYVSPSVKNILGYLPSELIGETIFNNIHPEDVLHVKNTIENAFHYLSSGTNTCRYKHKDGHYIWLEIRGNIIFDKNNNREGAILNARDVTQQIEQENRLRKSESLYKLITENSSDVVGLVNSDKRIVFISPAIYKILGFSPDEIKSIPFRELYHPEDIILVKDQLKQGIKESKYRVRLKHKKGHFLWVEIASHRLFDHDGRYLKSVVNIRDVNDEVIANQKIIENEKKLKEIQKAAKIGSWKYNFTSQDIIFSDEKLYMLEISSENKRMRIEDFIKYYLAEDPANFIGKINEAIQLKDPQPIKNLTVDLSWNAQWNESKNRSDIDAIQTRQGQVSSTVWAFGSGYGKLFKGQLEKAFDDIDGGPILSDSTGNQDGRGMAMLQRWPSGRAARDVSSGEGAVQRGRSGQ